MKITAFVVKPGQWRLLRDISGIMLHDLEADGWWVKATWTDAPSITAVLAVASRINI